MSGQVFRDLIFMTSSHFSLGELCSEILVSVKQNNAMHNSHLWFVRKSLALFFVVQFADAVLNGLTRLHGKLDART